MYESPIMIYETAMETIVEERENAIFAKIQSAFDVDVDKAELLRALQYDRNQYEKGYADGKRDAMSEVVRCKACKKISPSVTPIKDSVWCREFRAYMPCDGFCSYGERREGE